MSKTDVFLLGDFNVNYKIKTSPSYKKFNFFAQSNSLTQHINTTTRNTDKSKSLIDLALTNSKFISQSGTLEHFISDHQPIYIVHKKARDARRTVKFEGRSYRNFDKDLFRTKLGDLNWHEFYNLTSPEDAWSFILNGITTILDQMCPIRTFNIKNYRPDWMSKELIELAKDRDYFYNKAKKQGDEDSWRIAKYLRNITNISIRQAKRDFVLNELDQNERDPKKFWKTIRKVIPDANKSKVSEQEILLKDGNKQIEKENVAHFVNEFFINVGNIDAPLIPLANQSLDSSVGDGLGSLQVGSLRKVTRVEVT